VLDCSATQRRNQRGPSEQLRDRWHRNEQPVLVIDEATPYFS
jgi:hypothetical protein